MQPEENKFITLLTPREQQAVDNINAVLNGDGSDPESGPGAWGDCGEVDAPVVLEALARLSLVPAASLAGGRLPDAFTNALGVLEHLGREGVAEHLEKVARIWQGRLSQIPGLLARAEGLPKSVVEIQSDIERLEAQKNRNKLGREALLKAMQEQPSRREEFEAEYAGMKRRYEDYDVRIQALDWVLVGA